MRRMLGSALLLVGVVAAPVAGAVSVSASASAETLDPDGGSGVVVGVDILPRPASSEPAGPSGSPGSHVDSRLADSGADVSPALLLALAFGASGIAVAAASRSRARHGRPSAAVE